MIGRQSGMMMLFASRVIAPSKCERMFSVGLAVAWIGFTTVLRIGRRARFKRTECLSCAGESIADGLEWLGGIYSKIGQTLATRRDLLPEEICHALDRLQDRTKSMNSSDVRQTVQRALGCPIEEVFSSFEVEPVASATIAQVHRGVIRASGAEVAVKVKRLRIEKTISVDIAILQTAARLVSRIGKLRFVPIREALDLMCESFRLQCNFIREAENQRRCRTLLHGTPDVLVPRLVDELCRDDILVMEYVPHLSRIAARPDGRQRAVVAGLRALYRMIFCGGVVHCDLHPGNILISQDGRAVILDFGFAAVMQDLERRAFAEFFLGIAADDGLTSARVMLRVAAHVPANLDEAAFQREMCDIINGASRCRAGEFRVAPFVASLFAIQARYHIQGSRLFAMAIVALVVFEGTVRQECSNVDFQREAIPFVLEALNTDIYGAGG